MLLRHAALAVRECLADTPVVYLEGARQVGKSTLAGMLRDEGLFDAMLTFDTAATRSVAQADPDGFVAGLPPRVVIDEVQRVPSILTAIKASVDRRRAPGRFLLTGSAAVLARPVVSESLAGRMERVALHPLSQGEIAGLRETFIDRTFGVDTPWRQGAGAVRHADLASRITAGGFPEALERTTDDRRAAWFTAYVTSIIERDLRDLASIEGQADVPRLLALLAARSGTLTNMAEISRSLGMPQTTLKRYLAMLEILFLVQPVPAWTANLGKRPVRAPKMCLVDTGLACALLGVDASRLSADSLLLGAMLESFVAIELRKQAGWAAARPRVFHFRTHAQQEVDLVLEDRRGRIVGIEIKASHSVDGASAKGLRALAELAGDKFVRGVILHLGTEVVPFEGRIHAVPVTELWSGEAIGGKQAARRRGRHR